ncbi:restriction endonuclease subunit S [Prevotella intermedia]|uniref:restriction endonuclease subunit S n=1 Tax=Prevotella intermedia TaxID=28131 RepID=UPI000C250D5A|nr:restriction endonuclease subunit S [Prevotella intermedia]PJI21047.1 restriction endonuclease subunit S [Prevotella intermedia]
MELRKWLLGEVIENYDYLRKPLSSMERKSFKGEFPYYGAQGIIDYIADYRCDGEFLLIAEDGENLSSRNAPIAQIAKGKYWVNNHAHIVKNNDNSDLYYICYLLNNSDIAGYITGSAQPKLSQGNLNKIKIALPSLPIQQKIASILSTYDTLIENNYRRIRLLEQMAENLYKEWFVRFRFPGHEKVEMGNGLPKGWEFKKISNICETIGGGTPSTTNSAYWGGNIKWVTPSDITSKNSLALLKIEGRITEEGLRKSAAKLLPPYTILMTSRASIGFFGLCPDSVCTNQGFISIVPNKANTRMYLLYTLKERKDEIIANANGSTFLEISKGRFRKMKVLIPPEVILDMYEKRSHIIFNEVLNLEKQNTLLTRQRDLLLPRLMSGKLEVKP